MGKNALAAAVMEVAASGFQHGRSLPGFEENGYDILLDGKRLYIRVERGEMGPAYFEVSVTRRFAGGREGKLRAASKEGTD